ncbi:N-acetyltransferase [Streptomyces spinoverrucosus]|uniref:N-acetyltransferase n=1 Tax=Streptomyces spinoverrucosus TaxID=284043 RepID=A0A4Y3VIB2_9ACTN|nr:GNAT family N-acetyltransferase [Streptomyces spinoverrucosus]GEC06597.1 N-acetyltransferase [Streptomyces spinoverrucosus]GHB54051.1 N-acetyltransferase [Streptomyces spinoverrucosus]
MRRASGEHAAATWTLTEDLDAFLAHVGPFLRSRPALHTVPLTVTDALRRHGLRTYGDEPPFFGFLERAGAVRAVCFRTPPHCLYLTALTPDEADAFAAHLAARSERLPGVAGVRDTAAAFAGAWQRHTGAVATLRGRQLLYRLGSLTVPEPAPPGRARVADERDREQLARWYVEFTRDVGGNPARDPGAWADARIAHGGVTLWERPDGTPVAMAGVTPEIAGQVRVAPVYTPAPFRRRGYAGAVTAEVSRAALAAGAEEVLLFTDLANPTSNALYRRIGYEPVVEFATYAFDGR